MKEKRWDKMLTVMLVIEYMYLTTTHSAASLAQSAARQSHNLKVVSSSLTGGTFFLQNENIFFSLAIKFI